LLIFHSLIVIGSKAITSQRAQKSLHQQALLIQRCHTVTTALFLVTPTITRLSSTFANERVCFKRLRAAARCFRILATAWSNSSSETLLAFIAAPAYNALVLLDLP
jgi:hypothetical protein